MAPQVQLASAKLAIGSLARGPLAAWFPPPEEFERGYFPVKVLHFNLESPDFSRLIVRNQEELR